MDCAINHDLAEYFDQLDKKEAKIRHILDVKKSNLLDLLNSTDIDGEREKDEIARNLFALIFEEGFDLDPTKHVSEANKERAIDANNAMREVVTIIKDAMQNSLIRGDTKAYHCVEFLVKYA